jgi:hypothetical protein
MSRTSYHDQFYTGHGNEPDMPPPAQSGVEHLEDGVFVNTAALGTLGAVRLFTEREEGIHEIWLSTDAIIRLAAKLQTVQARRRVTRVSIGNTYAFFDRNDDSNGDGYRITPASFNRLMAACERHMTGDGWRFGVQVFTREVQP